MSRSPSKESVETVVQPPQSKLLDGVCFFVHDSLTPVVRAELSQSMIAHGARPCSIPRQASEASLPAARFDKDEVTHLITDSIDFPEYRSLVVCDDTTGETSEGDSGIAVVLPSWATRSIDLKTVLPTRHYSAHYAQIFAGLYICSSALPDLDNQAIQAGVESLGGGWRRELTKEVTHLIAVAPAGPKYEAWQQFGQPHGMLCVLPDWFEECIRSRQRVSTIPYQFPSPPFASTDSWCASVPINQRTFSSSKVVLPQPADLTCRILGAFDLESEDSRQRTETYYRTSTLVVDKGAYDDATLQGGSVEPSVGSHTSTRQFPPPVKLSRSIAKIFSGRRVYLSSDLGLRRGLEDSLKRRIEDAGGTCWSWGVDGAAVTEQLDGDQWSRRRMAEKELKRADTVVTRTREGWEYWHAFDSDKMIGNIAWLYHVLATSKLDGPLNRLLHYPRPAGPIPGFENLDITISNYTASARDYVRTMIEAMGAKFTGSMSRATTHVITASFDGVKARHAELWGIPAITHRWLDACFISWTMVDIQATSPFFPDALSGVSVTALLGQTPFPFKAIQAWADLPSSRRDKEEALMSLNREEELQALDDLDTGTRNDAVDQDKFVEIGEGVSAAAEVGDGKVVNGDDDVSMDLDDEGNDKDEHENENEVEIAATRVVEVQADKDDDFISDVNLQFQHRDREQLIEEATKDEQLEADGADLEVGEEEDRIKLTSKLEAGNNIDGMADRPVTSDPAGIDQDDEVEEEDEHGDDHNNSDEDDNEVIATVITPRKIAHPAASIPKSSRSTLSVTVYSNRKRGTASYATPLLSSSSKLIPVVGSASRGTEPSIILPAGGKRKAAGGAAEALRNMMMDRNVYEQEVKSSGKKRKMAAVGKAIRIRVEDGRGDGVDEDDYGGDGDDGRRPSSSPGAAIAAKRKVDQKPQKRKKETGGDERDGNDDEDVTRNARVVSKAAKLKTLTAVGRLATAPEATGTTMSSFDAPLAAKAPRRQPPIQKVQFLITGVPIDVADIDAMVILGAKHVDRASPTITHLVVANILRTEKFMCALAFGPKVVTKQWIINSIAQHKILDASEYALVDKPKEKFFDMNLEKTLVRARQKKIFAKHTFYFTPKCQPSRDILKKVVECHGGVAIFKLPTHRDLTRQSLHFVISSPEERSLWEKLASTVPKVPIYTTESVLTTVLRQQSDFNSQSKHRCDLQL